MPRPTSRISSLPPFSQNARISNIDESSLPTIPHPPSPPCDATGTGTGIVTDQNTSNFQRYSAIPLISSIVETNPNGESESFSHANNLNTGAYHSLSRIPSYRLPSPVSLPSRHNSRIQRDRGMSVSPVSSISTADAPITNRYAYLIQPPGTQQSPSPPAMPHPPPAPSQEQNPIIPTMGLPQTIEYHNQGQPPRFQGPSLTTINESTPNLPSTNHGLPDYALPPPLPDLRYDIPPHPQHFPPNDDTAPAPPQNTFQRLRAAARSRFGHFPGLSSPRGLARPHSLSQFVRRHVRRPHNHPPTPALAIIGFITSILVFVALVAFLFASTFAANIVGIVYAFSVLVASAWVLVQYSRKKRRARGDEERGGSRFSLFGGGRSSGDNGGRQPEMDMVQESEIIVIPRMPVHRVVGEAEADPELPPYTRGDAAEILDIPVPPPAAN